MRVRRGRSSRVHSRFCMRLLLLVCLSGSICPSVLLRGAMSTRAKHLPKSRDSQLDQQISTRRRDPSAWQPLQRPQPLVLDGVSAHAHNGHACMHVRWQEEVRLTLGQLGILHQGSATENDEGSKAPAPAPASQGIHLPSDSVRHCGATGTTTDTRAIAAHPRNAISMIQTGDNSTENEVDEPPSISTSAISDMGLCGLMVKASASGAGDSRFKSGLRLFCFVH